MSATSRSRHHSEPVAAAGRHDHTNRAANTSEPVAAAGRHDHSNRAANTSEPVAAAGRRRRHAVLLVLALCGLVAACDRIVDLTPPADAPPPDANAIDDAVGIPDANTDDATADAPPDAS
jgi:hypothetical protein